MLANRIADDALPTSLRSAVKQSLLDLLSEQSSLSHPSMAGIWRDVCSGCDLGIGTLATLAAGRLPGQREKLRALLGERVLRITVKPFMDMNTMIEERLTQCCVHVATVGDDGGHQCAPFCAVQAWAPLSRQRISTAVGLPARRDEGHAMTRPRPAPGRAAARRTARSRADRALRPAAAVRLRDRRAAGVGAGPGGAARLRRAGHRRLRQGQAGGLLRSRCKLGDTRLVLLYLTVLAAAAGVGIYVWID